MLLWGLLAAIPIGAILASFVAPRVVEYIETIDVEGSTKQVFDAIRYQSALMQWSAWPSETGSNCIVDGPDGQVGAMTVFFDTKGRRFGFQEVTGLLEDAMIAFRLESAGPPHKPEMTFYIQPFGGNMVRVIMHFRNRVMPPFHAIQMIAGITAWTRRMHKKDLDGLRRFVERNERYTGEPVGSI